MSIGTKNGRYAEINIFGVGKVKTKSTKRVNSKKELDDFLKEKRLIFTSEEIECIKQYAEEADLPE